MLSLSLHCFKFSYTVRPVGVVSRFPSANWSTHFAFGFFSANVLGILQNKYTAVLGIFAANWCSPIFFPPIYRIISFTLSPLFRANIITVGGLYKTIISHKLYKIQFSFFEQLKFDVRLTQYKNLEVSVSPVGKKRTVSKNTQIISCRLYLKNNYVNKFCLRQDLNLRPPFNPAPPTRPQQHI